MEQGERAAKTKRAGKTRFSVYKIQKESGRDLPFIERVVMSRMLDRRAVGKKVLIKGMAREIGVTPNTIRRAVANLVHKSL